MFLFFVTDEIAYTIEFSDRNGPGVRVQHGQSVCGGATVGVKWHEVGQGENAAIAGWTRAVPWPLDREKDAWKDTSSSYWPSTSIFGTALRGGRWVSNMCVATVVASTFPSPMASGVVWHRIGWVRAEQ